MDSTTVAPDTTSTLADTNSIDNNLLTPNTPSTIVAESSEPTAIAAVVPTAAATSDNGLSKRAQKRQRKLAQWENRKKEKRLQDRRKFKEKRLIAAAQGVPGPNSIRKALKRNKIENSLNKIRVAIDMDYEEQMTDKDISKCAKQLLWVYTTNRKTTMPIQLYYTSLKEDSRIVAALRRNDGYVNWDINLKQESYLGVFEKSSIVYLTSDSDTVLEKLDPNAVYIIGGLVDHNHHKGISLARAEEHGLRTARLPLGENVSMQTRAVLTIVHGNSSSNYSVVLLLIIYMLLF